jgi:predicted Zn-dependent peptidase
MKSRFASFLIACCLTVLLASLVSAENTFPKVQFSQLTLDNGLRVILAPDHTAPVLAISVAYDVGSRNERPGRTGFAHLFEHMMFQGSENVGKGEHFILLENYGGDLNGTTNEDRTIYYETVPKNQLDLLLFLESDRMAKLAVNQANLDNQRNAVQEERRLGIDNQPYGKAFLEIDSLAYDCFGYKHSTIGSMADLSAADLNDVKEFFRIYYAPNNAVLTLVGDFDPAEATEKIKKYFAAIPRQPSAPAAPVCEEDRYGERRETIMDPLARVPMVLVAYQAPVGNTPENYAIRVLADILGTGQSSRLYEELVRNKQLATQVQVQPDARRGPSLLYFFISLRPGVKPEDAEKALYEVIDSVVKNGVTADEIKKAQMQNRRRTVTSRESALQVANRLGNNAIYFNDPDLINTSIDKFNAVTAEDVQKASAKFLVPRTRTVVTALPPAASEKSEAPAGGQQ